MDEEKKPPVSGKSASKKTSARSATTAEKPRAAVADEQPVSPAAENPKAAEAPKAPPVEPIREDTVAAGLKADGPVAYTEDEPGPHEVKIMSPMKLVMKRFFRSKLSMIGLITIVVLFLFAFLGPVFSPWGETEVDSAPGEVKTFVTEMTFVGADGETYTVYDITTDTLTENIYGGVSAKHWLGTDAKGMDVLTRLMYGGRISLSLGFIVVILETLMGVLLGGISGYFGKWVDQLIMRIVDVFNCLPTLPILLIASALIDGWGVEAKYRIYYLMIILTFFGWSGVARLVRGQILSLREQEFMVAAEATGLSTPRKIFKHLIPNVMPQLIVVMTLGLGSIILYESTLSYLGLGVPYPYAAWGTMIASANNPIVLSNHFNMWGPPGLCIVLAVLAFNFVGDGLRDAFDPKMKR